MDFSLTTSSLLSASAKIFVKEGGWVSGRILTNSTPIPCWKLLKKGL